MTLGETQRKYTKMVAELILFAYSLGYEMTFGAAYELTGHHPNSNHKRRLAIDLNLFKNGVWLEKGHDMEVGHGLLHDKWDVMGGAKRIWNDLNHYSMEWQGMR